MIGFADRAVEVLCPTDTGWTSASGLLVNDRLVLTAAHAVPSGTAAVVRGADKVEAHGVVLLRGDPAVADLALIELAEPRVGVPELRWGTVDRESAAVVNSCRAIGYPRFQENPDAGGKRVRDTAQLDGVVPTAELRVADLLTFRVTSTPRPLPPQREALGESQWSGVSGTVVVTGPAGGEIVLGVVTEHQPRAGESALTVTPITHIDRLVGARLWWTALGTSPGQLVRVPEKRTPAYRATVAQIAARTPVLRDRVEEMASLYTFATSDEGYRRVVGGPWTGKTALAAHLVSQPPEGVDCVAYLLQRRVLDANGASFLAAVTAQLAVLLGEEPPIPTAYALADLWHRAGLRGRHLLLVVDGLDEDLRPANEPSVASLLPAEAGGLRHVLVIGRPGDVPDDVDHDHPLRTVAPITLEQAVTAAQIEQRAEAELRGLVADPAARKVLGLLAAAAAPMTADELADVDGSDPFDVEAALRARAQRVLEDGGGWRFAHQTLLDACRESVFGERRLAGHVAAIDAWADRWARQGWPENTPRYLLVHYPWALVARGDQARLAQIAGPAWLAAALAAIGFDALVAPLRAASLQDLVRALQIEEHHLRTPKDVRLLDQLCLAAARAGLPAEQWVRAARNERYGLAAVSTSRRASRSLMRTLEVGSRQVWLAAFLTDTRVVTGGEDGTVSVWDLTDGSRRPVGSHSGGVRAAAVRRDLIVSAGDDQVVRLFDAGGGEARTLVTGIGRVWTVAISPDGTTVATGGRDRTIRLWNVESGEATVVGTHDDQVRALAFGPRGDFLVSAGRDDTVRVWWPARGVGRILGRHDKWVEALAISPDGTVVVAASYDGLIRAWPLDGGPHRDIGRHEGQVWALTVTPDGREVVSGGGDGLVVVWPLAGSAPPRTLGTHREPVRSVGVSPDGSHIVSGSADGTVQLWERASATDGTASREAPFTCVAVRTDGRGMVAARQDGVILDYSPGPQGSWGRTAASLGVRVRAITVSGSRWMAVDDHGVVWAGGIPVEPFSEIREWDAAVATARHPGAAVIACDDVAGSQIVCGGGETSVTVWSASTFSSPLRPDPFSSTSRIDVGPEVTAVAVNREGTIVTGHLSGSVRVIRKDSTILRKRPAQDPVHAVAVRDDKAITGDTAGRIHVWSLATGEYRLLARSPGAVNGIAFTDDVDAILTAGEDGLRMWSLVDGSALSQVRTEPLSALSVGAGAAATISPGMGLTRWRLAG